MNTEDWIRMLNEAYLRREEVLANRYDRSLSFTDAMFDRWERARRLGFGNGSSIYNSALVYGNVKVAENTWIGPFTILDGSGGGLVIGSYCSIAAGVHIYSHDTVLWALSGGKLPRKTAPVSIGENTYIGSQSVVTAGVSIGRQCVIASSSLVNRDVPEKTVVGGSPVKVIGKVTGEGKGVEIVMSSAVN